VRDTENLARLLAGESAEWRRLWGEVENVLRRAGKEGSSKEAKEPSP
jgi:hypothetical protein